MRGSALYGILVVRKRRKTLRRKWYALLWTIFLVWYADCLPEKLFTDSTSTVLLDRNGRLLGAHIAEDEQWRFQEVEKVPEKFKVCILQFEDREFYGHWGVSPKAVVRSVWQNSTSGRRVSGGSTITMQVIRLMRKNPTRSYVEKMYEMVLATRLEWRCSKEEILRLYSSHAPFGNNVVGIEAASWRFFGRPAKDLSWAESATLAVLPNAPGLIYPGKNHGELQRKRNQLLCRLRQIGKISRTEYELALLEQLPDRPQMLPNSAPHLLQKAILEGKKGRTVRTTVDLQLQEQANFLLGEHCQILEEKGIHNASVLISSVKTGEVLVYIGNTDTDREHAPQVDCIEAKRSTGSILKPLLYAKSLEDGVITPSMMLPDVPSRFGSFAPKNFAGTYDGLVPADECLTRSLNIPMVHLVNRYGLAKFHNNLQRLGFSTMKKSPSHYGLSLILGGAEIKMIELNGVYNRMAQELISGKGQHLRAFHSDKEHATEFPMDRGCIYTTFNAMVDVKRPDEENNWSLFESSQKIAWKTGTSYGFRDAWAVGVTPDYVVSVWVGNADGEGRPGLTGVRAAAPILFDLFQMLPSSNSWFEAPVGSLEKVLVCSVSGHRSTPYCDQARLERMPKTCLSSEACPYHKRIHVNAKGLRVNSDCASMNEIEHVNWMVLPAEIESYYLARHPTQKPLPKFDPGCVSIRDASLTILYPRKGQKLYLPVDFKGEKQQLVLEASHVSREAILFWHLDGHYFGQTQEIHQILVQPEEGKHKLTVMTESGEVKEVRFEIVGKRKMAEM